MSASAEILIEIIRRDGEAIEHHRQEMARLGTHRGTATALLNDQGWGYEKIAETIGISKARVQQLVRIGRRSLLQTNDCITAGEEGTP